MRRSIAVLAAVLCLLAVSTGDVLAAGALDQSQTDASVTVPNWLVPHLELSQPFTAHLTGTLDSVDVYGQGSSILFEIQGGGLAVTQTVNLASSGWTHITLNKPPSVKAGTTYEIILATSASITWDGSCSATVAAGPAGVLDPALSSNWMTVPAYGQAKGNSIGYCTTAFAFRTYVSIAVVSAPTAAPTAKTVATPTATEADTASPSADASVAIAAASESVAPTDSATPTAAASPSAAPASKPVRSSDSGAPIVPIVLGIVVLAGLVAGAMLWMRRRNT